jgi:GNAT superfamily N-acetyltransferase
MNFELIPFRREETGIFDTCVGIWNAACGPDLAITPRGMEYNTRPSLGIVRSGRIALAEGKPVGFILSDATVDPSRPEAWVDALAVLPAYQKKGLGKALLDWAEVHARAHAAPRLVLGASRRWFAPGLPTQLQNRAAFEKCGFLFSPELAWDLGCSLKNYRSPTRIQQIEGDAHPLRPDELDDFLGLMKRDFAMGWDLDVEEYLGDGGPLEDLIVLYTAHGLDAFCWITHPGSFRPLDRFFPHGLARPWGQLGMVGVAEARRGLGLSLKLMDGALHRLIELGVDGCIIDWTGYLDLYAKLGFRPHRSYYFGAKMLD